jgi:hypothetical protein
MLPLTTPLLYLHSFLSKKAINPEKDVGKRGKEGGKTQEYEEEEEEEE